MVWFTGSPRKSAVQARRKEDSWGDTAEDHRRHRRVAKRLGDDLPAGFDALVERLVLGGELDGACVRIGESAASAGVPLDEVLVGLEQVYRTVHDTEPPFPVTRLLVTSWTEASLQYLHAMSCEDPLTGLASLPHVRSGLNEVYRLCERTGMQPNDRWALVVAEIGRGENPVLPLWGGLAMLDVAEAMRAAFDDRVTVGRAGNHRVLAIVRRDATLPVAVGAVQELLATQGAGPGPAESARLWIEGLPPTSSAASRLLDELAR